MFLLLCWPTSTVLSPFYHLLCSCFLSQVYCRFLCTYTNVFLVWVIMLRVIKWKHQFPEIIAKFLHLWLDFCVSFSRPFLPPSSWISLITLFHRKYSSVHTSVFSINVVFPILYFPAECFSYVFSFIILSLLEWVRMVFHFYFLWHFRSTKSRKGPILMQRFFRHGNTDSCIICTDYWSL